MNGAIFDPTVVMHASMQGGRLDSAVSALRSCCITATDVLYSAVLYKTVLCCAWLCCTVMRCAILHGAVLCCAVLSCAVLHMLCCASGQEKLPEGYALACCACNVKDTAGRTTCTKVTKAPSESTLPPLH